MKLEIERKFLLKSLPDREPKQIIKIDQWYWKNKRGIWERVRSWEIEGEETKWIHTIKRTVSKGVNFEDEKFITKEEYDLFTERCKLNGGESRFISKERWVYPDGELYWEVDIFNNGHHLIIAEIEIPKKTYKIKIPDFIKDKLLIEVTGIKEFSNRNLSNKII